MCNLRERIYKTSIWPRKALVEATPISGPQWIGKTKLESLAIELSITFTTAQVFILFLLHKSKAAYVSAVSPDWDTKTYKVSFLNLFFRYLNSDAISILTSKVVSSSNQYLAIKHEWYAVPQPIKVIELISWIFHGKLKIFISLFTLSTYSLIPVLIVGARRGSPLAVGYGPNENYLGSDSYALKSMTNKITYLDDGEFCIVKKDQVLFFNEDGKKINKKILELSSD